MDAINELWHATPVFTIAKGTFGDDSSQYELVGGTRLSDRKPIRRKSTS
jgi:hypothetical protein